MRIKLFLLLIIIFLGFFLRFYKLADFPIQLNHDEVSQLYDVRSIVETNKDVYGNFLPLAFPSTGEYKVGHYIYITTLFYKIFGPREITVRLPAAFFGSLTILTAFLFVKKLTGNWILALLSSLMIAITPSEIFYSRKSFENVIGVTLDFLGSYFLLKSLNLEKKKIWGIVGIFLLSLAMYIYTAQTIIVPLLLILFAAIYKTSLKPGWKKLSTFLFAWILFITPLLIVSATNSGLRFRAASVFITQDSNLGRMIELTGNPIKSYLDFGATRYLNQFNPIYIFANGLDLTNQGLIGSGPLLFFQLPFLILGILFLVRQKNMNNVKKLLFGMVLISMIPSAITFEAFSPHRAMLSFSTMSIISAFGLYWFLKSLWSFRKTFYFKFIISTVVFFGFFLNVIYFLFIYTVGYSFEKSQKLQYPFKQVAQFVWSEYHNFDHIIWDPKFGEVAPVTAVGTHYYLAYYGNYPPKKFQSEYRIEDQGLSFDKFSIRNVMWAKDKNFKKVLIIVSPWSVPIDSLDKGQIIKRFNFYDGQLAFYAIKL